MKTLLFVRHGETDMNVAGILAGRKEAMLTNSGRLQAKQAGQALQKEQGEVDLIVCSPSIRTVETAELIAHEIGYPVTDIMKNDLFLERTFGTLEGTLSKDFFKLHAYKDLDTIEGCETMEDLQKRAAIAFEWLHSLEHETVLVVGHAAFARAILRVSLGQPYTDAYRTYVQIENAAILELH